MAPVTLLFCPFHMTPARSWAPGLSMLRMMTSNCGQEVIISFSCCQPHQPWLSPFLSNSSCQIIKMAMSPSLEIRPQRVSVHSSPICSSSQTISCHNYSQSCFIWPASMHLTGRSSPSESQKCVQLSRAVGKTLWDLSDRLNHIIWIFSKRQCDRDELRGQANLAQLPTSVRPWTGYLNSSCLSFLTYKLSVICSL